MESVFAGHAPQVWQYRFNGTLEIAKLAGGVPFDDHVAAGWIKTKLKANSDLVRDGVAEVMMQTGLEADAAAEELERRKHLVGFKRDPERGGELYIEGRQLKAAIKEAVSVAMASGTLANRGWGKTNKGIMAFAAEHVQVVEERLYLGVKEPACVVQSFPINKMTNQPGIQYTEMCEDVTVDFTVISDWNFNAKDWATIWVTGELQGIGATRSQSYGRYKVVRWQKA
jgi:hypothetical protein